MDSFEITNWSIEPDNRTVVFYYKTHHSDEVFEFAERLIFPALLPRCSEMDKLLDALHTALSISYYKLFVAPTIVHPYQHNAEQAEFWNMVLQNGLGEFLHINYLSVDRLAKFVPQAGKTYILEHRSLELNKQTTLLGIGGGKDSIVAGELLRSIGQEITGFVLATGSNTGQTEAVARVMNTSLLRVERSIDPLLLELNKRDDTYNGHIPISLIFALVGSVVAVSQGFGNVVVANEASASIPTLVGDNGDVNHQWSKSLDFEKAFQRYLQDHVSDQLWYFSAIRQLSSVAVAKIFSKMPQYFEVFTSDNSVFKIDQASRPNGRWSINSPKSLSSFILFTPWLNETELLRIFGVNLLDLPELETLFDKLLGIKGDRPLDCVGTIEELRYCLSLAYNQEKFNKTYLIKHAVENGILTEPLAGEALLSPSGEHCIPSFVYNQLTSELTKRLTS